MSDQPKTTWYTYNSTYAPSYIFYPMGFGGFADIGNYGNKEFELVSNKQKKITNGNAEGYECTGCKDFYPFAELNQPEHATTFTSFACYGCRKGLKTIFEE